MADRRDLGSRAATREGSTPSFPTPEKNFYFKDMTLNIETVYQDDQQAKVTVEFTSNAFEGYKRRAARKIAKRVKIPGFRPGKAPYNVIVSNYGEGAIIQEAIDLMLDEEYPKILDEAEIKPSGPGNVESIESYDPPKFVFMIPLEPEVDLGEYREIRKDHEMEDFDVAEVDNFIENLKKNAATIVPSEAPAAPKDLVYFTLSGEYLNPAEDEDPTITDKTPQQIEIPEEGKAPEDEWPFKGFSAALTGVKAGDVKELEHTYPEDDPDTERQGKTAVFTVEVQSVKTIELPELDEELLQKYGDFATEEDFRDFLEQRMREEHVNKYESEYYNAVLDEIIENATIKYPPQMLEHEQEHVLEDIKSRLKQQNLDIDTYLKLRETDEETFIKEEVVPVATKRLERGLVIDALVEAEGLQIDEDLLQENISGILNEFLYSGVNPEDIQKQLANEDFSRMISREGVSRTMTSQLQERLKLIATGQPIPTGEEEEQEKSEPSEETESEPSIDKEAEIESPEEDTSDVEDSPVETSKPSENEEDENSETELEPNAENDQAESMDEPESNEESVSVPDSDSDDEKDISEKEN